MKISELIERLGRTVFEAPFGATAQVMGDSPEVAEIRIAVLDEVKKKIQRAGGQALFPYNVVRILIRAAADEGAVFERDFFRRFFDEEVRKGFSKEACRFPGRSRVEIRARPTRKGNWLRIETMAEDVAPPFEEAPRARRAARLVVAAGTANKSEIPLQKTRTNIGRLARCLQIRRPLAAQRSGVCRRQSPSIERCRANTRTLFTTRKPANIAYSTIAGTSAAIKPRTTAGCGSFATAWDRKCIATRAEHGCSRGRDPPGQST